MSLKRKIKKECLAKLDVHAKNPYLKEKPEKTFPTWATSILIPTAVIGAAVVPIVISSSFSHKYSALQDTQVIKAKKEYNTRPGSNSADFFNDVANFTQKIYNLGADNLSEINNIFNNSKNVALSPLNLYSSMAFAYDLAGGKTKNYLEDVLGLDSSKYDYHEEIKKFIAKSLIDEVGNDGKSIYSNVYRAMFFDESHFKDVIDFEYLESLNEYYYNDVFLANFWTNQVNDIISEYCSSQNISNTYNLYDISDERQIVTFYRFISSIEFKSSYYNVFEDLDEERIFQNYDGTTSNDVPYFKGTIESEVYETSDYMIFKIPLLNGYYIDIMYFKDNVSYEDYEKYYSDLCSYRNDETYRAQIRLEMPSFELKKYGFDIEKHTDKLASNPDLIPYDSKGYYEWDFRYLSKDLNNTFSDLNTLMSNGISIKILKDGVEAKSVNSTPQGVLDIVTYDRAFDLTIDSPFMFNIEKQQKIPLFTGIIYDL